MASPAFCPRQTNVEPFSTVEAAVGPCPAPTALGAFQNIMGSFCVLPSNAQGFAPTQLSTASINKSHGRQQLLPQGRSSQSPSDAVNTSTSNDLKKSYPRLTRLLTSSNDSSLTNLPKGPLPPSANTSVASSSTSAKPSGSKKYLSDDQILTLIENKLQTFRAQMKVLKERVSTDVNSLNSKSICSHGGPSRNTPASAEPGKAPENDKVWIIGEKELSNGSRQEPKRPRSKSSQTTQHSEEYVRIMLEPAAVCRKEEDSPVVLKALSGPTLDDLLKQIPSHTVHHKPSYQENESMRRNGNPSLDTSKELHITQKNVTGEVDIVPDVVDSLMLSKSRKTSNHQCHVPDVQTPQTMEVSVKNRPVSSAGQDNLSQNVDIVKSSVTKYHLVTEPEAEQKEEMQERTVEPGEGRVEMESPPCVSEGSSILKDPKYDDITDDEDFNVMPQLFIFDDRDGQLGLSKQSTDVNICANAPFLQPALTPRPQEEGPEMPLSCTCPYFVETDDGFEKVPCPKCAKDTLPRIQEVEYEDESEEVILFVTELELKEEAIVIDSDDEEEEPNVSRPEQHNQPTLFQKIKVYDTFASFYQSELEQHSKNLPNPLTTIKQAPTESEPFPRSLLQSFAVEKVTSEQGLSHSSLQKHLDTVEKDPEPTPAPRPLGIFEKFPCEPGPSAVSDAEDSCDTEDSLDYPSHTKPNYLTVSSRVQALSTQSYNPDMDEEGEVHRSPEAASNTEDWFPYLSQDETEEETKSTNNATVLPKTTTRPCDDPEPDVTNTFRKAKYKSRRVIYSDSESENDQDTSNTFRRTFSSENSEVSTRSPKSKVKPRLESEKSINLARSKSRSVSIDSTFNQNSNKTLKRTLSIDSDASTQPPNSALKPTPIHQAARSEAHGQVPNMPRSAIKRKGQTDHKSDKKVKRKRPSSEAETPGMGVIALSGREVPAQKNVLSLAGQNYIASSLPPRNQTRATPNTSRNPTQSNISQKQNTPTACTVQRPSQAAPHVTQRPSQAAPHVTQRPSQAAPHVTQRPSQAAPHVTQRPSQAAPHVTQRPSQAAPHVTQRPRQAAPHVTQRPSQAAPHVTQRPSQAAPHVTQRPSQAAPHVTQRPSQAAPHVTQRPSQAAPHVTQRPSQAAPHVTQRPSQAAPHVTQRPSQAAPHVTQRPSQAAPHVTQRQSSQTTQNSSFLNPSKVKSRSAKEMLSKKWANGHVPIRKERRSSNEAAHTSRVFRIDQDVSKPPPKPRQRNNSQDLQTRLMKKTKLEAQLLTKAGQRLEPAGPSIDRPIPEWYKWKGGSPAEDHGEDWLDRMHGDNFQRPHF
ncbi:uncharacterized protein [Eucyclogobius newberryi]|uniref:uncharacterized protein n=1 Tax=Eucyclogobius newberryi TaxID=166745 RepID=UPI003B5A87CD